MMMALGIGINKMKDENYFLIFNELNPDIQYWGFDSSNNIYIGERVEDKFIGHRLGFMSIDEEQFGLINFIIAPKEKPKPSKYEKHLYGNDFNVGGIIHDINRLTIDPRKVQLNKEKTLVLIDWLNDVLKGNIK